MATQLEKEAKIPIEQYGERYEELSRDITSRGENPNLGTDGYKEYKKVCNELAVVFPEWIRGWDAQGNTILNAQGNVQLHTAIRYAAVCTMMLTQTFLNIPPTLHRGHNRDPCFFSAATSR